MVSHPDPVIAEIAARYGAAVAPDLTVRRCRPGESAYGLVWDGSKLVASAPVEKSWGHPGGSLGGRAPIAVEVSGHRWPSQGACARALRVTPSAVTQAIQKGTLADLVARHLPRARVAP